MVPDSREARHAGSRRPTFRGNDRWRGRAVRAAKPQCAQLSAPWGARRRRHTFIENRRAGESVVDRALADDARCTRCRCEAAGTAGGERDSVTRIRLSAEGLIGRITLARPEKRNALDRETADELAEALFAMSESPVRVVALDAEGTDFCAGEIGRAHV